MILHIMEGSIRFPAADSMVFTRRNVRARIRCRDRVLGDKGELYTSELVEVMALNRTVATWKG